MAADTAHSDSAPVDLSNCDREPIHIPGFIQPHGMLFALSEPELTILQASDNLASHLGQNASEVLNTPLGFVLPETFLQSFAEKLQVGQIGASPLHVGNLTLEGESFRALAHRHDGLLILELERAIEESALSFQNLYALIGGAISQLESAADTEALCAVAAREVRQLTGLDKVMIYLFDAQWNGLVVAEERTAGMDEYLGLRFPASDIPRQARELYLRNKLRLIADVHATPVPIVPTSNPGTGRSLDLSYSTLRSVSPIHIEYLKNMGVGASMSISIVRDGQLAGLIACHHRAPKFLSYEVRTACEVLGQVLALQLAARENTAIRENRLHRAALNAQLLAGMTNTKNYVDGLVNRTSELLELTGATGAAICTEDGCTLLGQTPDESAMARIVEWMGAQNKEVLATDALPHELPTLENSENACGILAISTSEVHRNFIVWFRPELVRTVNWAGNPRKAVEPGARHLHPRQSFEVWKETVHSRSLPWQDEEVEAASELRAAIIGIVLRQAEERAGLSTELQRTNQELEAFSYSVSHDLRAPFRHIVGFSRMLEQRAGESLDATSVRYLHTISESATYAGTLVDNLLAFSRMGRSEMRLGTVDMAQLFEEIRAGLGAECGERTVEWRIGPLPSVRGDKAMLRLVVQNLLSNAVKYTRERDVAVIEVECHEQAREWSFSVRDNGVGFDMNYVDKLFGVFQRLHRVEEFEGTGIGLANVRRIVLRHGGRVWAEGMVNEGAAFGFELPKTPLPSQAGESQTP